MYEIKILDININELDWKWMIITRQPSMEDKSSY